MKIIITGLVGALIGYITNWLAIKMIFRPHKEMYIGKFKVPFTPGLIPKEKARIASSVGHSIGKHLLNEETIQAYLCGEKVDGALKTWMKSKIESLKESKATLGALLKNTLGEGYDKFHDYAKKLTKDYLKKKIKEEDTRDKIIEIIKSEGLKVLEKDIAAVTESDLFVKLQSYVLEKIKGVKNSEKINETISGAVISFLNDDINSERKLNEIIPESTQITLYEFVEHSKGDISEKIINALKKENVKEKLVSSIDEMVGTKLSPMIAMFIKGESIYPMVVNGLDGYLQEEENQMMIADLINHEVKNFMENTVGQLVERYGEDKIKSVIGEGSNVLLKNFINNETVDKLFENFMDSVEKDISIKDFILKLNDNAIEDIEVGIKDIIGDILDKEETEDYISKGIDKFFEFIDKVQVGEILEKNSGVSQALEDGVVVLYKNFMNNNSSKITKTINIPGIVEEKINEFEMNEMEEIILEIANKELKAITWFGALLGFLMGIISSGISSI